MTSISELKKRGVAERRLEWVSVVVSEGELVRCQLMSESRPPKKEGERECRLEVEVDVVRLHFGATVVAREEYDRLLQATKAAPPAAWH